MDLLFTLDYLLSTCFGGTKKRLSSVLSVFAVSSANPFKYNGFYSLKNSRELRFALSMRVGFSSTAGWAKKDNGERHERIR